MSGKDPPRGPRALRESIDAHSAFASSSSSAATNTNNSVNHPINPRLGATPPTGPRSFQNNAGPSRAANLLNGKPSLPSGPAATRQKMVQIKWAPVMLFSILLLLYSF